MSLKMSDSGNLGEMSGCEIPVNRWIRLQQIEKIRRSYHLNLLLFELLSRNIPEFSLLHHADTRPRTRLISS